MAAVGHPEFERPFGISVPASYALVDLDEGFRLMVNVAGGEQPGLAIGAVVDIGCRRADGLVLPEARLAA